MPRSSFIRAGGLLAAFAIGGLPASAAQTKPIPAATAAETSVPAAAAGATAVATAAATVEGFRSARFGMDEAAVRAAIVKDFGVKPEAILPGENMAERTKMLSVRVPGVLEGGGMAEVSYVFGHKSTKLAQVSVLWSPAIDPAVDQAKLLANANVLQSYFLSSGYKADSVVTSAVVPEGLLMFRGSDAASRMTVLLLRGQMTQGGTQPVLTPVSLLLAYLADPAKPDVFTVPAGQF